MPGSSSAALAFPRNKLGRLPASFREHDVSRHGFRGCSYFFMFRPPSLLAPQIVPTAANTPAGRPRLLRPSRTCVVTFARIGYATHLTTGNWRDEDFHLARFSALSAAPYFAHESLGFPILLPFFDAQSGRSFYPPDRHLGSVARSWRRPFHRRGVASPQTPTPDRESLPATIAESIRVGPHLRRLDGALGASNSSAPFRNCTEALDTA